MSDFQDRSRPDRSRSEAVAKTAQEKVSEGAGLVGAKATDVTGTAKEQGANVVGEATSQARDLVGELRDQLQGQAHSQTQNLAQNVRRLADELREMSESGKPESSAAGVVRQLADGGHQVASRLEQRGPDGLVGDLQDFARRRPGVFLAGAALAGFAVARVGKGISGSASPSTGTRQGGTGQGGVPPRPTNPPRHQAPSSGPGVPQTSYEDPLDTYGQSQPPHVTPSYGQPSTAQTRPTAAAPPAPPPPAGPQRPTQGS
ncbi:hypothetical protein GPZ77_32605 [Streptomyces sp. QHH-9511]|uniref:hypothetical protein n=1 Tax=Streptomyces sp. QHH-9511 TaxID=2684468 RepID=UPI001315FDF6|nr:hypothetical protein [Streptomyces sp. QHH-9511]QGZ52443.1 hypothetical protein GPZ77_32605 [Streptomyces sp. QHH-9511]GGT85075.1 hypothetical protein GCM10010272_32200 [Streptomyces lateritius]